MTELCEPSSWDGTISFATLMTDFPVKWTPGAFVLFIDSNPSFAALNLTEERAQLSINSSNKPSDTSIMCLALLHPLFLLTKKNYYSYPYSRVQSCHKRQKANWTGIIHQIFSLPLIASIMCIIMHQSCTWRRRRLGLCCSSLRLMETQQTALLSPAGPQGLWQAATRSPASSGNSRHTANRVDLDLAAEGYISHLDLRTSVSSAPRPERPHQQHQSVKATLHHASSQSQSQWGE